MRALETCFIALIITVSGSPARADYHYVSHEGSDEYPYSSWETAADSIKFAIAASDPGDTVYIGAGQYYERVLTAEEDSSIAVIGAGIDSTFWWWDVLGENTYICRTNTLVKSIHFAHTRTGCLGGAAGSAINVEDCLFSGGHGGIILGGRGRLIAENCVFDSTEVWILSARKIVVRNCLVDYTDDPAFLISSADTAIFENNIILNSQSASITLPSGVDSSVVRNNLISNITRPNHWFLGTCGNCGPATNNTFDNVNAIFDYHSALRYITPYDGTVKNNSLSRMRTGLYFFQYTGWTVSASYFNLWDVDNFGLSDGPPIVWDTVGIQWAFPMYAGEEDYHLQAFSPLIDAGDPGIFDVDGSRSDIGVYGGPGGSSYPYLDLPPLVPESLTATVIADMIFLSWRYNYEADFSHYRVHRETYSGFEPSMLNLISEPDTSYYRDEDLDSGHNYYYRISAVDNQDNLSDYSDELAVMTTGVEGGWGAEMPTITAIETNYPNPFNSQTTILYTVANLGPIPAQINIDIFDIMGRKVKTLVNEREEVGIHRVTWDGNNDAGSECPSGVYFARISQWGVDYLDRHQKLVLLR